MIKSHILSLIKAKNQGLDQARDRWNGILESFAESAADLNMNRFLLHSWLSRREYVGEKQLFRSVKSYVKASNAQGFLDDLALDAELYRDIQESGYRAWTKSQYPVRDSLKALMLFRLRQPLPMVVALIRAYDAKEISLKVLIAAVRALESYHFIATAVTNQPSSGGVSRMYAAAARGVLNGESPLDRQKAIVDLVGKLRERLPSYAEFEASFVELRSSKLHSQQAPLVRYVLVKLHSSVTPNATGNPVDYDSLTVEHLAPQGGGRGHVRHGDAARVGNLLLVSQALNEELGDKSFSAKQKILKAHEVDKEILVAKQWGVAEIQDRAKRLARVAYEEVWKF